MAVCRALKWVVAVAVEQGRRGETVMATMVYPAAAAVRAMVFFPAAAVRAAVSERSGRTVPHTVAVVAAADKAAGLAVRESSSS